MKVATFEPTSLKAPSTLRPVTLPLWRPERPAPAHIEPDPVPPTLVPPDLDAFDFDAADAEDANLGPRLDASADEETGPSLLSARRRARRAWTFGAIGGAIVTIFAVSALIETARPDSRTAAKSSAPHPATTEVAPTAIAFAVPSPIPAASVTATESPATASIHPPATAVTARPTPRVQPPAQAAAIPRKPSAVHPRAGASTRTTASAHTADVDEVAAAAKMLAQARRESSL